jgi:shikimate 5-dehydrogenase
MPHKVAAAAIVADASPAVRITGSCNAVRRLKDGRLHGDLFDGEVQPAAWVGDVVMTPEMTPLLNAARARGCRVQVGTDMLFEQIPAYLECFGFPAATPERLRQIAEAADVAGALRARA